MRLSKAMSHPLPPFGGRRAAKGPARLSEFRDFGDNPGQLGAKIYAPPGLPIGSPLVVVLHGCTQTAEGYDHGSGWSQLAQHHGFAVVFPEQRRANNPNLCFNWFEPGDMKRGEGEPASIVAMVDAMVAAHNLDRDRVFVTGLSAGGAMANVMLATYPDVFAGGGIVAGLPYGAATSMAAALQRMRVRGAESDAALGALVTAASPHRGSWPRVSIWHGTADSTVSIGNSDATVAQWRAVHGIADDVSVIGTVDGCAHSSWHDAQGRACVEEYRIEGMGHGTPIDPGGPDGCGNSGAFLLDVGISSTHRIAEFWGLIAEGARTAEVTRPVTHAKLRPMPAAEPIHPTAPAPSSVQRMIEDALKSAGLMR